MLITVLSCSCSPFEIQVTEAHVTLVNFIILHSNPGTMTENLELSSCDHSTEASSPITEYRQATTRLLNTPPASCVRQRSQVTGVEAELRVFMTNIVTTCLS
jgi:hypothetical protein